MDKKTTLGKKPEEESKVKEFDYQRDKGGWVTFLDRRPKKKLKKYVRDCAQYLARQGNGSNSFNTLKLIEGYNENGLPGIAYRIQILEQIGQGNVKKN